MRESNRRVARAQEGLARPERNVEEERTDHASREGVWRELWVVVVTPRSELLNPAVTIPGGHAERGWPSPGRN